MRQSVQWLLVSTVAISRASEWSTQWDQMRESSLNLHNQQDRALRAASKHMDELHQRMQAKTATRNIRIAELKSALSEIDAVMNVESAKKCALQQLFAEQAKVMRKKREEMDAQKDHHIQVLSESLRNVNDRISDATQGRDVLKKKLKMLKSRLIDADKLANQLDDGWKTHSIIESKNKQFAQHSFVHQNEIYRLMSVISQSKDDLANEQLINDRIQDETQELQSELDILAETEKELIQKFDRKYRTQCMVYTVSDLTSVEDGRAMEMAAFQAAKLHPLMFREKFKVDHFDHRGDMSFDGTPQTYQLGPPGLKEKYTQPRGWTRYGLNVLNKHGSDQSWLVPFDEDKVWWKAYHGTYFAKERANVHCTDAIFDIVFGKGFHVSEEDKDLGGKNMSMARYGSGVYCAPDPEDAYIAKETLVLNGRRRTFEYLIMCAVRPSKDGVNKVDHRDWWTERRWWVVKDRDDIRPYAIIIREK